MAPDSESDNGPGNVVTLATHERQALMDTVARCRTAALDFSYLLREAYPRLIRQLPERSISALVNLREVDSPGIAIIRGLPIDHIVPPTPAEQRGTIFETLPVASTVLVCLARVVGEPFTWGGEHDGSYLTSVHPTRQPAMQGSSHGTGPLPLHTETLHLAPYMPSHVALLCVRSGAARTLLANGRKAIQSCKRTTVESLQQPLFWAHASKSFHHNTMTCGPMSVIVGPLEQPEVRYGSTSLVAMTPDAAAALVEFGNELAAATIEVELAAGDLLIFDNRKIVHGRTGFTAALDGTDRWLLRSLIASDLWRLRQHLDGYHIVKF